MGTSFFSYSRVDHNFALKLAEDLRKNGIEIWFDQFDIPKGALWDVEIEKALQHCDTLIVVISSNSVKSKHVLDEISYALEENKRIIPVKISNCEIPFRIRRLQYVDFTNNEERAAIELHLALGISRQKNIKPKLSWWKKIKTKKTFAVSKSIILFSLFLFVVYGVFQIFSFKKQVEQNTSAINITDSTTSASLRSDMPNFSSEKIDSIKFKDSIDMLNNNAKQKKGITTATFVDKAGNEIIKTKNNFDKKMPYSEGLAAVRKDGKWGFVNENNEIAIPITYSDVGYFVKGYSPVRIDEKFTFINKKNKRGVFFDNPRELGMADWEASSPVQCSENGMYYYGINLLDLPKKK